MREVGLVQDVVRVLRDGVADLVLEPETTVDLALEVLAGKQLVFGVLTRDAAVTPLPVEAFEGSRDPADTTLDGDEVQLGEAVVFN